MDWPPPTEDKTTLENTPCLGSGRQGLIQRLKNWRGMGGAGIRKAVRHARMAHKATKWPIKKILTGPVMRPDRTKLVK